MAVDLDVYRDWLGIKDAKRPLNHYQLLRVHQFEDDPVRIRGHYRKMNAHVRKYASGDYAAKSQQLLNELAKAMLCLTDLKRKAEYDASMGRKDERSTKRRSLEELLIARKVLDQAQLDKARNYATAVGLNIRDAVVQQKLAPAEIVMQVYAESLGLPYVELADVGVDVTHVPKVPAVLARQNSCAPVMVDDGQLLMASPNPLPPQVEDDLRLRVGMPVRTVLCTPASINAVINEHFPKSAAAAEMSAGAAAPQRAAAASGQKSEKSKPAGPRLSAEELAEKKKNRLLVTVAGFNLTIIGSIIALNYFTTMGTLAQYGLSFLVAASVAAVVYVVMGNR